MRDVKRRQNCIVDEGRGSVIVNKKMDELIQKKRGIVRLFLIEQVRGHEEECRGISYVVKISQ